MTFVRNRPGVISPGFTFTRQKARVDEPKQRKKAVPSKKLNGNRRTSYPLIHVDNRHGDEWPRPAGYRSTWTGWLTYREFNVIDFHDRFSVNNLYTIGEDMGIQRNSAERMYHTMKNAGVIEGEIIDFTITAMARILFNMTDQFILQLDLSHEED